MDVRQEFLVLETDGDVAVYAPSDFPIGTPIGRDAKRLRVTGPSHVPAPPDPSHASRIQTMARGPCERGPFRVARPVLERCSSSF